MNLNKTDWNHNHSLEFNGVTKRVVKEVKNYIAQEELKCAHTPGEIQDKVNAYIQGKENNLKIELPYKVCSYLHYSSVENIYGPSAKDATNLMELMKISKQFNPQNLCSINYAKFILENGLEKEILQDFVVCTETMKNLYSIYNDVILIDTTYKSNKFRMPLLVVAGISGEGRTFLVGFGALYSEEEFHVNWVLSKLFSYLEKPPQVVCTDSCPTLKKVISNVIPDSVHLLCGWHVEQNIAKHLAPISNIQFSFLKHFFRKKKILILQKKS